MQIVSIFFSLSSFKNWSVEFCEKDEIQNKKEIIMRLIFFIYILSFSFWSLENIAQLVNIIKYIQLFYTVKIIHQVFSYFLYLPFGQADSVFCQRRFWLNAYKQ